MLLLEVGNNKDLEFLLIYNLKDIHKYYNLPAQEILTNIGHINFKGSKPSIYSEVHCSGFVLICLAKVPDLQECLTS